MPTKISKSQASQLISSRYNTGVFDKLDTACMKLHFCAAESISIAAAFYDTNWLKEIIGSLPPTVKSVRLLFNGLGGQRLKQQISELGNLKPRFEDTKLEIKLVFCAGIFHSKIFVLQKKDQ